MRILECNENGENTRLVREPCNPMSQASSTSFWVFEGFMIVIAAGSFYYIRQRKAALTYYRVPSSTI